MKLNDHHLEVEAILNELAAKRLSEEEAFLRIRALSAAKAGSPAPFSRTFDFEHPLLRDHQLFGQRILMGVTHCSLALEAARERHPGQDSWRLEKVVFQEAIQVLPGQTATVEVRLEETEGGWKFTSGVTPRISASGRIQRGPATQPGAVEWEKILRGAVRQEDGAVFYSRQRSYGPSLTTLRRLFHSSDGLIGEYHDPSNNGSAPQPWAALPAFFDSAYVTSLCAVGWDALGGDLWVPLFVHECEVRLPIVDPWFCRTWVRKQNNEVLVTDHEFYNARGERIGFLRGLTIKRVPSPEALGLSGVTTAPRPASLPGEEPASAATGRSPAKTPAQPGGAAGPGSPGGLPSSRDGRAGAGPGLGQVDRVLGCVEHYLCQRVGGIIGCAAADVSVTQPFLDLGAESSSLIAVVNEMEREMGLELYPTLFFEYQTIRELSRYLAGEYGVRLADYFTAKGELVSGDEEVGPAVAKATENVPVASGTVQASPANPAAAAGDIAVIGMSGRFAQSRNLQELWGHLAASRALVGEVPRDHWDLGPWYDARPQQPQKTYCKWGSFLDGIDKFDPLFFHLSPREADFMDPQLRLLLEVLYETTEDAGYASRIWGTKTGMYVGVCFKEYWDEIVRQRVPITGMESFSSAMSFLANRPSYFFDLRGPSVPVDDACSSSLVALHLACKALQAGECEMAFASGINVLLSPLHYVYFSAIGALSPTGRCHSFSKSADGYVPGEGIVSVLLKPLDRAIRDGDNIHAVIKGSALNHGGRANNPTSPRTQLQTEVLLSAWKDAGISPETLGYLEAHGTGTLLGDPIEVDALKRAFKPFTSQPGFCALGSIKANLGHTEGAAGLAGVVKAVLSMQHGLIPAMPGFDEPNPYLKLEGSPLYINREAKAWPRPPGHPRRAGVSSFGMGGAYAHVVVEDYVDARPRAPVEGPQLLILSAKTEASLKATASRFHRFLGAEGQDVSLADLAHTLQAGRQAFDFRLAIVGQEKAALGRALDQFVRGEDSAPGTWRGQVQGKNNPAPPPDLSRWWQDRDWARIAAAWAGGAEIPWAGLAPASPARRISLPFYAFEERSHWMPATGREGPEVTPGQPSLDRWLDRVVPSLQGAEFSKVFNGTESILRDHSVLGATLLPGVAHLEMALAAVAALGQGTVKGLADVTWKRALAIKSHEDCRLRLVAGSTVTWSLGSQQGEHTMGRVEYTKGNEGSRPSPVDLHTLQARCTHAVSRAEAYARFAELGIEYGSTLQVVEQAWVGKNEALVRLVDDGCEAAYRPTALLDGMLQAAIAFFPGPLRRADACLPFSVDFVQVFQSPSGPCWVHAMTGSLPVPGREVVMDFVLLDDHGVVLAKLDQVRLRPAQPVIPAGPLLRAYRPAWRRESETSLPPAKAGTVLIFRPAQDGGWSDLLWAQHEGWAGATVYLGRKYDRTSPRRVAIDRSSAADFERVVAEHPVDRVYFLCAPVPVETSRLDEDAIGEIQAAGLLAFLRLVRALPADRALAITVVTCDLHDPLQENRTVDPWGALVAGAAKVAAKEYPRWTLRGVDVGSAEEFPAGSVVQVTQAECALRAGGRYCRELQPLELPPAETLRPVFRPRGVYLVVGGHGGLGLATSRFLAKTFQARLVLVGRGELGETQRQAIRELEAAGGEVLSCRADVADRAAMTDVIKQARAKFGQLHGVIHSALALEDRAISRMDDAAVAAVLRSKMQGCWVLDTVTRDRPLDFLALYSSVNAWLAPAGQANYVAASAFEDAFGAWLRTQQRPATVINWGLWGEVGIMAKAESLQRLQGLGVHPIRVAEGLDHFARILGSGLAQVISAKIETPVFASCGVTLGGEMQLLAAGPVPGAPAVSVGLEAARPRLALAEACEEPLARLEQACADEAWHQLQGLRALPGTPGEAFDPGLPARWEPRFQKLWVALLAMLERRGLVERAGGQLRTTRVQPAAVEASRFTASPLPAHGVMARRCLQHLGQVVTGEVPATDVLFPGSSPALLEPIYRGNPFADTFNALAAEAVRVFLLDRWQGQRPGGPIRLVEIGSGTGGTSQFILEAIAQALATAGQAASAVEFHYTDIAGAFVRHGQAQFGAAFPFARFNVLDIDKDPAAQGIAAHSVDLVVAANVLHATASMAATLGRVKRLLRRDGLLVINELTRISDFATVTFGLLDGWWLAGDAGQRLPGGPLLSVAGWHGVLREAGFCPGAAVGVASGRQGVIVAASDGIVPLVPAPAEVPSSRGTDTTTGLMPAPVTGPTTGSLAEFVREQVATTLRLSPAEIGGDKRFSEYGIDSILAVDLVNRLNQALGIKLRTTILFDYSSVNDLSGHLQSLPGIRVPTVGKAPPSQPPIPAERSPGTPVLRVAAVADLPARPPGTVLGGVIAGPGGIADVRVGPISPREPGPGEIQVEVRAFALNFGDWLCVRGLYPTMPDYPFVPGFEVAGEVCAVGPGVSRLAIGDAVMALTGRHFGGHAERVTVNEAYAVLKPAGVSFEEAAAYPVAFLTAYHALETAGLRPGETILVQTAAGGTGLMAVQLAQQRGATVIATAGSAGKLAFLREMGVTAPINYRERDFAPEARALTAGRGVDLVFNTLPGEAIQQGIDLLAPGGRYVEIAQTGLRSATSLDLSRLTRNQAIYSVNLLHFLEAYPDKLALYLEAMVSHLREGRVKPQVSRVFALAELAEAYRQLESRANIGKIVVALPPGVPVPRPSATKPATTAGPGEIAIIGMSGRFPGCDDLQGFWANLAAGRCSVEEVPAERWPLAGFYDPDPAAAGRSVSRWGGFLRDIDQFDPLFFNLSGREAERMDPQQRLFLEEAWHALENAGYSGRQVNETRCGLFVGASAGDYSTVLERAGVPPDGYVFTGNQPSILAARLAYFLNLKGPALAIDTACSSSLVALHLACQAIRQGDVSMALAGGVFINTTSNFHVLCSKAGMLSPGGQCRAFDQGADGFVPGEGVGVIVLKSLGQALADGDRVVAVIKGSGMNQDGKTNGITAPSAISQAALEREVYERHGIDPASLSCIEAHGTGTKLGDPIEVEALTQAFRGSTRKTGFCALGSVKGNIGHAATAAGIAGTIKVALSLQHGKLPPSLHFQQENEHLQLRDTPFFVNGSLRDWVREAGQPRRAAVSAFGFSGTNCHVVMEEAPPAKPPADPAPAPWLFAVSAKSAAALQQRLQDLVGWLAAHPGCDLPAASYTLNLGRDSFECRVAVVAADEMELRSKLEAAMGSTRVVVDRDASREEFEAPAPVTRELMPGARRAALETWARFFEGGGELDAKALGLVARRVALPGYPFTRARYWPTTPGTGTIGGTGQAPHGRNGSLAKRQVFPGDFYLRDHVIGGRPLVPAVVFLEWARSAAQAVAEENKTELLRFERLAWLAPLAVSPGGEEVTVSGQFAVNAVASERSWQVEITSTHGVHFRGEAVLGRCVPGAPAAAFDVAAARARGTAVLSHTGFYELCASRGISYGRTFRVVQETCYNATEALATLVPDGGDEDRAFTWAPGIWDGILQSVFVLVQRNARLGLKPFVPVSLAWLEVKGLPGRGAVSHAILAQPGQESLGFDLCVANPGGLVVATLKGLVVREWRDMPAIGPDRGPTVAASAPTSLPPRVEPRAADSTLTKAGPTSDQVAAEVYLRGILAAELKVPLEAIRAGDPFEKFGLDSLMVNEFNLALEKAFGVIPKTLFFEYRNLRDLAGYFSTHHGDRMRALVRGADEAKAESRGPLPQGDGPRPTPSREDAASSSLGAQGAPPILPGNAGEIRLPAFSAEVAKAATAAGAEDIAIIGVAGRFPQAPDLDTFWANLNQGRDSITEIPPERWDIRDSFDPDRTKDGAVYAKWGGFIEGFDRFDPLFFRISPQEAGLMDPQERHFLEIAYSALEDAGYTPALLREKCAQRRGKDIGVFVGVMWGDYQLYGAENPGAKEAPPWSAYWSIANRVSYSFDFQGPSLAVDTACSSSLVAIHLACESLQRGHCRAAIAGGVNLSLHPNKYRQLCQMKFASTDGRCRSFGAGGDGYVPGEGVGAILLKPLAAALADGDRICGVIKATGCNHGGKTNGYSVPNPNAQAAVIADVLERSGVPARTISFVEAHGTGTSLGDPIEIAGLSRAFGEFTPDRQYCPIGSAKSNIGHLEAAAGIAAVIKVVLQLRHRQLPPSLHSATTNPNIRFPGTPFYLQHTLAPWRRPVIEGIEYPLRAGVSSFGAGGANAHLVLEEFTAQSVSTAMAGGPELIVLSARDPDRLRERVRQLQAFLSRDPGVRLADVAYTLQVGREPMAARLAFLAADLAETMARLDGFLRGEKTGAWFSEGVETLAGADTGATGSPGPGLVSRETLGQLGQAWVRGLEVNWQCARPAGARPARVGLPAYPFAGERYWFHGPRVADAASPRPGAPPASPLADEFFFSTAWQPAPLPAGPAQGSTLAEPKVIQLVVFDSSPSFVAELERELARCGHSVQATLVRMTEGERVEDVSGFAVRPSSEDDFRWMMERWRERGLVPTHLVSLWGFRESPVAPGEAAGLGSAFWLAQLLQREFHGRPLRWLYVAREIDGLAHAAEVAVSGLGRTFSLEAPQARFCSLYLPGGFDADGPLAAVIRGELLAPAEDPEIRRRHGERWARRVVVAAPPSLAEPRTALFRRGGVYLLTGGLGELGVVFSRYLAKDFQAKLVLLGRGEASEGQLRHLAALNAGGAEAIYLRADLAQPAELERAVDQAKAKFGSIQGVLHLACVVDDALIFRKTTEQFHRVLQPKVAGTVNLDHATRGEPLDFFISFSSVVSILGNAGQADYAAACRFQDGFAESRERWVTAGRRQGRSLTIAWSQWEQAGHSAPREVLASLGVRPLAAATGWQALQSCWDRPVVFSS